MTHSKWNRITALAIVVALLLPGISLAKKPKPYDNVVVTYNQELAEGCSYLGDVEATSIWGGVFDKVGRNRAKKMLRKRAYKIGGNLVVVAQRPGLHGFVSYGAMVFACPADENGRPLVEQQLNLLTPAKDPDHPQTPETSHTQHH